MALCAATQHSHQSQPRQTRAQLAMSAEDVAMKPAAAEEEESKNAPASLTPPSAAATAAPTPPASAPAPALVAASTPAAASTSTASGRPTRQAKADAETRMGISVALKRPAAESITAATATAANGHKRPTAATAAKKKQQSASAAKRARRTQSVSSDSSSSSSSSDDSSSGDDSDSSSSAASSENAPPPPSGRKRGRPRKSSTPAASSSSSSSAAAAAASSAAPAAASTGRRTSRVTHFPGAAKFWMLERNDYTLANSKGVEEDEASMCGCVLPADAGAMACVDDKCINRQLKVECPATCRMKSRCGNQCFTRRQYAKLDVRPVGPKGHGLFCLEDMRAGQFVIEYVGEIVSGEECERRIHAYANSDHFYLMSLAGDDSIDATKKGNLSRFINHSCAPNCETQKWEVNGLQCVGLFILTNVPAGTELTFDYKYQRYGGKKTECLCMAPNCAKFLGGKPKPLTPEGCICASADAIDDSCPAHKAAPHAVDKKIALEDVEALTRSTRHLLRPLPPPPRPSTASPSTAAAAAVAPVGRTSRSAAAAAAAAAWSSASPPAASSSFSSSAAAAAAASAALARPYEHFPRALRKAQPLRVLQVLTLLREAQARLQAAANAAAATAAAAAAATNTDPAVLPASPPPPLQDMTIFTLQQLLQHSMPQVSSSRFFLPDSNSQGTSADAAVKMEQ